LNQAQRLPVRLNPVVHVDLADFVRRQFRSADLDRNYGSSNLFLPVKNIEIKAHCEDLQAMRDRLRDQGVSLTRRIRQVDTYFNVPRGRLKLREIDDREAQLIHYHRPDVEGARESDYIVVPVIDPRSSKEALNRALGVRVVVEKVREVYHWDHTRVHLDEVKELGTFTELETVITDQTLREARSECDRIQRALGIGREAVVLVSYADLIEQV